MPKFTVEVSYIVLKTVEVEAKNSVEAAKAAKEIVGNVIISEYVVEDNEGTLILDHNFQMVDESDYSDEFDEFDDDLFHETKEECIASGDHFKEEEDGFCRFCGFKDIG